YTHHLSFLLSVLPPPPTPTLFPYTTLFRSNAPTGQKAIFAQAGRRYNIDPAVLWSMYGVESRFGKDPGINVPHNGGVLGPMQQRSEEHTSELQSQSNLVCRLLLEKKNN